MSTRRYSRKALILLKQESTEGTDSTPTAGQNALKVRDLSISPLEGDTVELSYIRGYYGANEQLRVSSYATCEFTIDLSGTGTAGTAVPWADALLCCGFSQTLIAAAVTGTATAGTTSSITLAAGASAIDGYYNGLLLTGTGGTNSGETGVIIGYVGSTKVATLHKTYGSAWGATSVYSISPAAIYNPVTDNQLSASIYYYLDGVRHVLLGARGSVSFDLSAGSVPSAKFNFIGTDASITDQANPTPTLTAFQPPVPLLTTNVQGRVAGQLMTGGTAGIQVKQFTLDIANDIKYRQLLGAAGVVCSGRNPKGSLSIEATTQTFKDWFADAKNITKAPWFIRNGTTSGNMCTLFGPAGQLANLKLSDDDGIALLNFDLIAAPNAGNDEVRLTVQ